MKTTRPFWVELTLLGINHRWTLWLFVWLSLVFAVGAAAVGVVYDTTWVSLAVPPIAVFSAAMYYLTVRWLERHDGFDGDGSVIPPHRRRGEP